MTAPIQSPVGASTLSISQVGLSLDGLDILANISMTVEPGRFVSIVGPSGAGKSTILKLLTGALAPDRGDMTFGGAPLPKNARTFAFMPQRDALMPWRSILDNAALGLEVRGMSRRKARETVAPLFAEFGLSGFETHYPGTLSGGMRQRAALLRTVVQDCPFLLLDEPFGALDALTRTRMQAWLEDMWLKHRWTAILVTHDVREAVALSDRVYVLSARPARIAHVIDIDLPRPRLGDEHARREAAAIEGRILDHLLSASNQTDTNQTNANQSNEGQKP